MITICWAAKGGSGTTVVAAALALTGTDETLLVDLAGDLPAVLGCPEPDGPGVGDWLGSDAPASRLEALERPVTPRVRLVHIGDRRPVAGAPVPATRWTALARRLADEQRRVVVDAGTGDPPAELVTVATHAWLVTRPCYLALRAAIRLRARPTGIVVVDEPGRALRPADLEATVGAPIVATMLLDPAIARAVDAGLVASRLPAWCRRQLGAAA